MKTTLTLAICAAIGVLAHADTTITISTNVITPAVKRFGIDLAQINYYDSNQQLKEHIHNNPGFEGILYQSIVQIGSGQTTRLLAQAMRDCGSKTEISVIDEHADRTIDSLVTRVTRARFEDVEVQEWIKLGPGDILFCDTSHIFFPGTDVDKLLNEHYNKAFNPKYK
jgi:hypothetical protein